MLYCFNEVFVKICQLGVCWGMTGFGWGLLGWIVFGGGLRVSVSSLRLGICVRKFVFICFSFRVLFVCIVLLRFCHYFQLEY